MGIDIYFINFTKINLNLLSDPLIKIWGGALGQQHLYVLRSFSIYVIKFYGHIKLFPGFYRYLTYI